MRDVAMVEVVGVKVKERRDGRFNNSTEKYLNEETVTRWTGCRYVQ